MKTITNKVAALAAVFVIAAGMFVATGSVANAATGNQGYTKSTYDETTGQTSTSYTCPTADKTDTILAVSADADDIIVTLNKKYAGESVEATIESSPQSLGWFSVKEDGTVRIANSKIAALGLAEGNHTITIFQSEAEGHRVIGKFTVVLNADGTINVAATNKANSGIGKTAEAGFPVVPAGIALLALVSVIGFATRRKSADQA